MNLRIPTAARRQVSERVFPLRKAVAVEIARIPRRKGDERRYAAVLQSFGIRDLEERARGRVDLGRKAEQAHFAQVVAQPDPLFGIRFVV